MLLATYPIASGKTVSYKIIDKAGTVVQDWTTSGVTERQIDATANKSIYQVESNAITAGFEGHIWWKTADATPLTLSQTVNLIESYILSSYADISTLLSRLTSTRATNLDNLAKQTDTPATPTFTSNYGILPSGTYSYKITATNAWGETLASSAGQIVTSQMSTPAGLSTAGDAGTLSPNTYYYKVLAINAYGKTLLSAEVSYELVATGGVKVMWGAVSGATGYQIFGRSTNTWKFMAEVGAVTEWVDDGSITPTTASITRSGTTATVTQNGHGYVNGQQVVVFGADQADYNGTFTITNVTANTFDYEVANSPATPATGSVGLHPGSNTTNGINVNWVSVANATGYKVYGRTAGNEQLLATLGGVTTWQDTGMVTPSGALPTRNTAGLESELNTLKSVADGVKTTTDKFLFNTDNYVKSTYSYPTGQVVYSSANTPLTFDTSLTETKDDYWADLFLKFTSGQLKNQVKKITGFDGATGFITVASSFTDTPVDGDTFEIINT